VQIPKYEIMTHHQIEAYGVSLHYAEMGDGPVVLFCHGFPAIWSSWEAQMDLVAGAGYKAVAFDLRGYGESSVPEDAALYTPYHTVGDVMAILDAVGAPSAVIVGHDWGANVAWSAAMMRPDRIKAVAGLSVQFRPPGGVNFLDKLRAAGKHDFYMFHAMKPEADKAWSDAAVTIPGMMFWSSGEAPDAGRWDPFDPSRGFSRPAPAMPRFVSPAYLKDAIAAFQRTGFHGALNYYRAIDIFDLPSAAFAGARIHQPSMFLGGTCDGMNLIKAPVYETMREDLTDLCTFVMLEGIGHWPQMEATEATNAALLEFLQSL
jgi:pimeloyl-ACP methyl ester carboxylesterase